MICRCYSHMCGQLGKGVRWYGVDTEYSVSLQLPSFSPRGLFYLNFSSNFFFIRKRSPFLVCMKLVLSLLPVFEAINYYLWYFERTFLIKTHEYQVICRDSIYIQPAKCRKLLTSTIALWVMLGSAFVLWRLRMWI